MSCDVGEVTVRLENELCYGYNYELCSLQPFHRFTYVKVHSPTLISLLLRHKQSSFSNLSVTSPTLLFILQPFFRFSYVRSRAHSPTFPSFHLRHNSFSNPSVALPMSQLILQPFRCFTYVIVHSPTLLSLLLRHKLFIEFTWRAVHDVLYGSATLSLTLREEQGLRVFVNKVVYLESYLCLRKTKLQENGESYTVLRHKLCIVFLT